MRTSFHHQPEAQHPNFPLSVSWQADYPIFGSSTTQAVETKTIPVVFVAAAAGGRRERS